MTDRLKLRRIHQGGYETLDGRFQILKQENITECDHPLCDQLHERFLEGGVHWTFYYPWIVWDEAINDYAEHGHTHFDTKRDAVAWLESYLTKQNVSDTL